MVAHTFNSNTGRQRKGISVGLRLAWSTQEFQGSQRSQSDLITKFKWGLGVRIRVLGLAAFQSSQVMLTSSGVHLLETEDAVTSAIRGCHVHSKS